jgi:hypothetical protein
MSDIVDETPEEFSSPGPNFSGKQVTIRVGSFAYVFESQPDGGLKYVSRSVAVLSDDEDDKPFNPLEYR